MTSSAYSQEKQTTYFAIGFFTAAHSQMITYAYVTMYRGMVMGAQIVSKDNFIYGALGHWPSPANRDRQNLFEYYGVDSCFLLYNELNKVIGYYAKPFDVLWKIKFYEHPYDFDRPGWSQGQYWPSLYQKNFLRKEYGLNNIQTDYIYGDSLFKLLRDVQNTSWIIEYRTASRDTSGTVNVDTTTSSP